MADGTSMQRSQDRNLQGDRCSGYSDATNQCFWRGPRLGVCNWGLWIQKNFGSSHLGFWSSGTCFFWGFKRNCVPRELWRFPEPCLCYLRWHSLWCPGPKRSFRTGNLEPCRRWVMSVWLLRRAETLWDHRSRNPGRGYKSGEGEMCFFGCGMDMSQHLLMST